MKTYRAGGFTLIEVVMVLFFSTILMVVLFDLYQWHNNIYNYQQAVVKTSSSGRATAQTLQDYISQAHRVLDSASVNGTTYTTSATTLALQLPAIDTSGNILAGKWDTAVFYPSGSNFYLRLQPDSSSSRKPVYKLLSNSLSSFSFSYNNASYSQVTEVSINIQSQLQVKNQTVKNSLQQNMYLNNY